MKKTRSYPLYRFIKFWVRVFSPKLEVIGAENLPDGPALVVGNHSQMYGPMGCELYFPGKRCTWCAGQMMHLKEVPAYAYQDFWSGKPKGTRWFYKALSYIIAPICVCIFNNADTIGVYHDGRILSTFKNTVKALTDGARVIVFPECYDEYNHIVHRFQENFVDVARLYGKRTGQPLAFVPLYIAPKCKQMHIGKPIYFDPAKTADEQRHAICQYLMDEITAMATALPLHTVVPYPNISRKLYPTNRPSEATPNDQTTCN